MTIIIKGNQKEFQRIVQNFRKFQKILKNSQFILSILIEWFFIEFITIVEII